MSVLMVWGTTISLLSGCKKEQMGEVPPPPAVEVADVLQKDVPVYSEWVASTDGFVNATIRAQVQGYLITRNYKEGISSRRARFFSKSTLDLSRPPWIKPRPLGISPGREVEDALIDQKRSREQLEVQARQVESLRNYARFARLRF